MASRYSMPIVLCSSPIAAFRTRRQPKRDWVISRKAVIRRLGVPHDDSIGRVMIDSVGNYSPEFSALLFRSVWTP